MKKIKPLGVNILVKPIEEKATTSGIILPDKEKEEVPQEGEVVAIGKSKNINSEIKSGAKVIFRQYSGDKIEMDDVKYIILDSKKDILAIIEN